MHDFLQHMNCNSNKLDYSVVLLKYSPLPSLQFQFVYCLIFYGKSHVPENQPSCNYHLMTHCWIPCILVFPSTPHQDHLLYVRTWMFTHQAPWTDFWKNRLGTCSRTLYLFPWLDYLRIDRQKGTRAFREHPVWCCILNKIYLY